jgi:phosphoglycolate phosphatase
MKRCANVFFDLDGTLLDSRGGIVAGLRRALREMGHELPENAELDWAVGPPLVEVMARLLAPFGDGRVAEAADRYREWYGKVGLFDARVYPGVPDLLATLRAAGKALFVCTSKRTVFARRVLEHFGLSRHFRAIRGTEPHGRFDRKAELIRDVLLEEGLRAEQTVLVGDREHDVIAARANGVGLIAAAYGYGTREELLAAGAEVLCSSPDGVLRLLGAIPSPGGTS